jgi:hypothetical protein
VRIDGEEYQLRAPEELTFDEHASRIEWGAEIEELARDVNRRNLERVNELTQASVRMVLIDVPDEVIARLNPGHMRSILSFFRGLVEDTGAETSSTVGEKPGAGVNASTAAA